jgi:hypothetical protein
LKEWAPEVEENIFRMTLKLKKIGESKKIEILEEI